jgi:hypothetical protein
MHDANNQYPTGASRLFTTHRYSHLVLYHSDNFEMSIHGSWEDLPPTVMGYRSDDAAMEAVFGKSAKGLSDRAVAVNLGP